MIDSVLVVWGVLFRVCINLMHAYPVIRYLIKQQYNLMVRKLL